MVAPETGHGSYLGPKEGLDPLNLAETGWGVIFAHDADPAVKEALGELLNTAAAAGHPAKEHRYQEYVGEKAYRPGESKQRYLARQGVGPALPTRTRCPTIFSSWARPKPSPIPFNINWTFSTPWAGCTLTLWKNTPSMPGAWSRRRPARLTCRGGPPSSGSRTRETGPRT